MIKGIHGLLFSTEPEALRAFMRDKLEISHTDTGGGWLIFDFPEADLGGHLTDFDNSPPSGTHDIPIYCDDIDETATELRARGVEFSDEVTNRGYDLTIHFEMPGGVKVDLYQPLYKKGTSAS
jgi:predicted enzyme related to lactoylglutathione lyase